MAGICVFEGWAQSPEEAFAMCEAGKVEFEPNHHHGSCGPMAGTITGSFPVYIVRNTAFNNTAISRPADLSQQFGDYRDIGDIRWWRDGVAPYLGQAIRHVGGIPLNRMMQEALDMGDEAHNRNNALASMLSFELVSAMMQAGVPQVRKEEITVFFYVSFALSPFQEKILPIMNWFSYRTWNTQSGVRAFLGLVMAFSKVRKRSMACLLCGSIFLAFQAVLDPVANIEYSTIVHCMARNGYEFGIRVSSLGDQWFK